MIAPSNFSGDFGLRIINGGARTDAAATSAAASFARPLGKAKTAADATFMHAMLGLQDPQNLQAEIGTLFGRRPTA
jgi:hypothetical protein